MDPIEFRVDDVAARAHTLAALSTVHRAIVEFEIELMNGKHRYNITLTIYHCRAHRNCRY